MACLKMRLWDKLTSLTFSSNLNLISCLLNKFYFIKKNNEHKKEKIKSQLRGLHFINISISRKRSIVVVVGGGGPAMLPNGSWVCSRCGTSTAHPCQVQRQGDFALEVQSCCSI